MRITREADYAFRIVFELMKHGGLLSARAISENAGVTQRFTLKILHKLSEAGIVESKKGVSGGYRVTESATDLSLGEIVECIDGPFELTHCLDDSFECTRVENKNSCPFHHVFGDVSVKLKQQLGNIKLKDYIEK